MLWHLCAHQHNFISQFKPLAKCYPWACLPNESIWYITTILLPFYQFQDFYQCQPSHYPLDIHSKPFSTTIAEKFQQISTSTTIRPKSSLYTRPKTCPFKVNVYYNKKQTTLRLQMILPLRKVVLFCFVCLSR